MVQVYRKYYLRAVNPVLGCITIMLWIPSQLLGCIPDSYRTIFKARHVNHVRYCHDLDKASQGDCYRGQQLFFNKGLSADSRVSCSDCHKPQLGFGSGSAMARARQSDVIGPRVRPLLDISRKNSLLFWNGRASSLESAVFWPLYNKLELGATSESLSPFGGAQAVAVAIASFLTTLQSSTAPWDRYLQGQCEELSEQEKLGFQQFVDYNCHKCHYGAELNSPQPQQLLYTNLPHRLFSLNEAIYSSDWPLHGPYQKAISLKSIPQPLRNLSNHTYLGRFSPFQKIQPYLRYHMSQLKILHTEQDLTPLTTFLMQSLQSEVTSYANGTTLHQH